MYGIESVNPNAYTVQKSHIRREMEAESKKTDTEVQ